AGLAADRTGPGDLEAMRLQLDRMRESIDAPEGYVDADVEFHALLARGTRNEVLLTMLEPVVDLLRASRRVSAARPGNALRALGEHEEILRRVEEGDAAGAREEMRAHLAKTAEDIEAAIGEGVLDAGELREKEEV
ncbi:MAG TPA: FCD domain-containing protein, partial [Rubrobacter sp.]|nr:FCD domain-containing protein [Rubrobacter sp.]